MKNQRTICAAVLALVGTAAPYVALPAQDAEFEVIFTGGDWKELPPLNIVVPLDADRLTSYAVRNPELGKGDMLILDLQGDGGATMHLLAREETIRATELTTYADDAGNHVSLPTKKIYVDATGRCDLDVGQTCDVTGPKPIGKITTIRRLR